MTINERLISAHKTAELSIADMGVWFGIQRRTMETWLHGAVPHAYRHSQIITKLDLLEKAIKGGKHFPIPDTVTQRQRKNYIQRVINVISGRVSKTRYTK